MVFEPRIYVVATIGKGSLATMARPVPGEWIEDEFEGIATFGISSVVSLLENEEANALGLGEERRLCEKNQMEFLHYPIPDRGLPKSMEEFSLFCCSLFHMIEAGNSTVIHCRAGIGRASIVAAGVLIQAGISGDDAFDRIEKSRGLEVPDTEEQREWLITNQNSILSLS